MAHAARALGLGVMLGCMVESGSGSPPAARSRRSATTSTSTATSCSREDPWPGVAFVDGVQVPRTAGARCRPAESSDPGRGLLGRPALRQDDARRARVPQRDVVAILDSTRAGEKQGGVPDRRRRSRRRSRSGRRPRSSASPRRAAASRPRGGSCCGAASRAGSTSRTACTSSSPTIPSCAGWRARTASSCATCAGRPRASTCPTGANLELPTRRSCSRSARTARSGR